MRKDVEASVAWLRSKGVTDVACAGASIGANLCLQAAAADPAIVNVVMLSPGLNYKGVTVNEAIVAYGDRPVLLVASNDDAYSARSAAALHEKAVGQKHLEALDAAGHGTVMLNRAPGLENTMVAWINGTFKLTTVETLEDALAVLTGRSWAEISDLVLARLDTLAGVQSITNAQPASSKALRTSPKALPRAAKKPVKKAAKNPTKKSTKKKAGSR
jgi:acetyl esterase/lipase